MTWRELIETLLEIPEEKLDFPANVVYENAIAEIDDLVEDDGDLYMEILE